MGWFDEEGNFKFPPKEGGDPIKIRITSIEKVETENSRQCYKKLDKDGNSQSYGYGHHLILDNDEIMLCTTWKLFFAIKDSGCKPGDTIEIKHPGRAKYEVTIISNSGTKESTTNTTTDEVQWDE